MCAYTSYALRRDLEKARRERKQFIGEVMAILGAVALLALLYAGTSTPLALVRTFSPIGLCFLAGLLASLVLLFAGLVVRSNASR